MEEFIINETNKIFTKAINNFSKADKIEKEEVSILMFLKGEGEEREVGFKVCHHHLPAREVTMMNILGVRIDLKGYSILVPPQIKKIIEDFEKSIGSNKIEISVYLNREEEDEVRYFLYNDGTLLKEVKLQDVLKLS